MLEARSCAWLAGLWLVASLGHVHTQDTLELSISRVSVTTVSDPQLVEVCFTKGDIIINEASQINLSCWNASDDTQPEISAVASTFDEDSVCSTHDLKTSAIYGFKVRCLLEVHDDTNVNTQEHGEVIFDMPAKDKFPVCTFGGIWTGQNLLGLICQSVGNDEFNLLSEDDFIRVASSSNIIYYTSPTAPTPGTFSPCIAVDNTVNSPPETLKVCGGSVTVDEVTTTESASVIANLKYGPSTTTTTTLEVSSVTGCNTDTCDLLTWNKDSYAATTAKDSSGTFTNTFTKTDVKTDYLVVQYTTTGFTQSQHGVHTDYEAETTAIGSNILEIYWKRNDDVNSPYEISYKKDGETDNIKEATVICVDPDVFCFGYFVDVVSGTWSTSVASKDKTNVITPQSVVTPPLPNEEYQAVASVKIDTFIIAPVATPSTITVCFDKGDLPLTPVKENVHLTCFGGTPLEISSEATNVAAAADNSILCSTHNIPSDHNVLDPNLHCMLSINDENQVPQGFSEVILTMPEALFGCTSPFLMRDVNIMEMQCSARGDTSNVVIDVDTASYSELDITDTTAESTTYILIKSLPDVISITKQVLICYQVNNDAATSEVVKVCSSAGLLTDVTSSDLGIDKAIETYISPDGVKLTATFSDSAPDSYDILATESSKFICTGNKDTACTLTDYDRTKELAYIVVSGAPPSVKYQQVSVQGYNMVGAWLSTSTIEVNWLNPPSSSPFTIVKAPTGDTFDSATVDCEDSDKYCYGYFTDLTKDSYTVTLTPVSGKESVVSEPISKTSAVKGLQVQEVRLDWSIDGVRADASVCFNEDVARDPEGGKEYRVVMVDAQGHWLRAKEASQKREGTLCFSGAALDTRKFNTVDKVTVLVTRVGEDGRTALAHGEAHLFFMTPETEGVGGRVGRVTLGNPGGYTFTVRKEGDPAPVTTSTTGRFVHYFVPRTTGPEVERLVVETEGLEVKMTTVVPLTPHVVPGMWSSSTLICTHSGSCP